MNQSADSAALESIVCPNCTTQFRGNYCPNCGQDAHLATPTVARFVHEFVEKYFGVEGGLLLTLRQLFLHPGAMTVDYVEGRRRRYVSPLRFYFAVSVLFFLGLTLVPGISVKIGVAGVEITTEAAPDSRIEAATGWAFVDQRVAAFSQLSPEARNRVLRGGMVSNAPKAMLLLVPLFAALLASLYRHRTLGEHLVSALHFHSFAYLALLPGLVPWPQPAHDWINNAINLVLGAYLFLMLRRVYGGGRIATFLRLAAIAATYVFAIAAAALAGVVLAVGS